MRLPEIRHATEVQSLGRISSKGPQLIVETAKMAAESERRKGQMLGGAERGAGQIISDAMRTAARETSQQALASEKYKNDKIAAYSIQAAKFDIESKLEGDILKIKEERDKYILDREYERDFNILGINANLARTQFGIQAAAKTKQLNLQNQLKLDLLEIRSDAAWRQTFINAGVSIAKTAVNVFAERMSSQQQAQVQVNTSEFKKSTGRLMTAVSSGKMLDINNPEFEGVNFDEVIPEGVEPVSVTQPDGSVAEMVPAHMVATGIVQQKTALLQADAMAGVTSDAHIADLEVKLQNVADAVYLETYALTVKNENDWKEAQVQTAYDNSVEGRDMDGVIENSNIGVAMGFWGPDKANQMIQDGKTQVAMSEWYETITQATSVAAVETAKKEMNNSGLKMSALKPYLAQADSKIEEIKDNTIAGVYADAVPGLNAMGIKPGTTEGQTTGQLAAQLGDYMRANGADEKQAMAFENKFYGDHARWQASEMEKIQPIINEAKSYNDRGLEAPPEVVNALPDQYKAVAEKANKKIRDGGHIDTNQDFYRDQYQQAYSEDPKVRQKWANSYDPEMHRDKLKQADDQRLFDQMVKIKQGNGDVETSAMLKVNDTRFSSLANQKFGKIADRNSAEQERADMMHYTVNERLEQAQGAKGAELDENEIQGIINRSFNEDVEMVVPTMFGKGYTRKSFEGLPESPIDSNLQPTVDLLKARGIEVAPAEISALYNEAAKQVVDSGGDFTTENIKAALGVQDGALGAKAEILQNLKMSGDAYTPNKINAAYDKGKKATELAGLAPTDSNVMKMVDFANSNGVTLDQLLKDLRKR